MRTSRSRSDRTPDNGPVSPGAELKTKLRFAEPWVAPLTLRLWNHPALAQVFPEFLVRLYWSSEGSVRAIDAAARACRADTAGDPVCARLSEYYERHYQDEREHPEWLLSDMVAVGLDPEEVVHRTPAASAAALIGSQLYWIDHAHPVALLGHLAALEGSPPSVEMLTVAQERTGLPSDAFRMMMHHARIDVAHGREIDELLDELPLSPKLRGLVGLSALTSMEKVAEIYRELLAIADCAIAPESILGFRDDDQSRG